MENKYGLLSCQLETPLGEMIAFADEKQLLCVAFHDSKGVESMTAALSIGAQAVNENEVTGVLASFRKELHEYFAGALRSFHTPLSMRGTSFQQQAWKALAEIPYGETCSYAGQAKSIGRPRAFRAVALANAANWFTLVLPCHRVIPSCGGLGGYGGGVERKHWLLAHESEHSKA